MVLSEDGSLKIHNVTRSDAGAYTCIATNQFGVAKNTGNLVVKGIPSSPFVHRALETGCMSQSYSQCHTCVILSTGNI